MQTIYFRDLPKQVADALDAEINDAEREAEELEDDEDWPSRRTTQRFLFEI